MVPRFFIIGALVLFVAIANIGIEAKPQLQTELLELKLQKDIEESFANASLEDRNEIIDKILKMLKEIFVNAAKNCLKKAAENCKKYWYNPKKLVKCTKEYIKENLEECGRI